MVDAELLFVTFPLENVILFFLLSSSSLSATDLESPNAAIRVSINCHIVEVGADQHRRTDEIQESRLTLQVRQCSNKAEIEKEREAEECNDTNPVPLFFCEHASGCKKFLTSSTPWKSWVEIGLEKVSTRYKIYTYKHICAEANITRGC